MSIETMMVKSFVAYYKAHNAVPDRASAANPADWGLVSWLEELVVKYKKGKKIEESSREYLDKNGLYDVFLDVVRPNHHVQAAREFVAYLNSRDIKEPLVMEPVSWQRHRNWFYAHAKKAEVQPLVSKIFAAAGYPDLESANLNTVELKEAVFVRQAIEWHKVNGKLPCPASKHSVEKKLGQLIQGKLNSYSQKLLAHHSVSLPTVNYDKPIVFVPSSKVEERVASLETIVEKLTKVVEGLANKVLEKSSVIPIEKKPRKKRGTPLKPIGPYRSRLDSSDLIGLAVYHTSGQDLTVGIENVISYASGNKKYILRMPAADGKGYSRKFFRWGTCEQLKQVMLNS